jgi:uncharacterized repeat protein (TIGR03803 family)
VIYSFGQHGKRDDGQRPAANLIAVGGELYGTTEYGGLTNDQCYYGCGTIFKVTASGMERVVYRFKGGRDGAGPVAGLIAVNRALYGTTSGGGATACSGGCGTVFKVSTNGAESVVYRFQGGTDGANPVASLTTLSGRLYGTTQYGGAHKGLCSTGCGTVFEVSTSGAESVVYRFQGGKDGAQPIAELHAFSGTLYGTTQYGGSNTGFCTTGCGTIFRLSASGVKKTLYAFKYTASSGDGAFPAAGVIPVGGKLYGTTLSGGDMGEGTVFEASPSSGMEHVLHSFNCCATTADGTYPLASLLAVSGVLYGTTRNGGIGTGTVFRLTTSAAESVLHEFAGKPDGTAPQASLIFVSGALYGTTTGGGAASLGSVFRQPP